MDDRFMHALKTPPPQEFANRLRERLAGADPVAVDAPSSPRWLLAAAVVLGVGLLALPSVRMSAQAFLNLFRVVNFTAVPINVDRLNGLAQNGLDLPTLIGQQAEVLEDAGPLRIVSTLDEAAAATRLPLKMPAAVPPNLTMSKIEVSGQRAARIKGDVSKLRAVMDALGIADLTIPEGLDGQVATLRVFPSARVTYANGDAEVSFTQARSPEVTMPAGIDLARLGEIGLRVVGLEAAEAHTLAEAIDWRGTFIVPVPVGVSSFRQVDIRGSRGLLVASKQRREIKAVMWSAGGVVYGISGPLTFDWLLQMAISVQ